MKTTTVAVVVAIAIASAARPSYADNREKAAEHFALAEAAEKRSDLQSDREAQEILFQQRASQP